MIDEVKAHISRHKTAYLIGAGVTIAGVTYALTRSTAAQNSMSNVMGFCFKSNQTNNMITIVERGTQGPPSFIIRCKETGEIFLSQRAGALAHGLDQSHLSQHLNGLQEHVNGLHFERLGIAI